MTDESGSNILISKIIGLIIGIGLVFVLFYLISILLFQQGEEESTLPEFQYTKLVKLITESQMGYGKLETYSSTREFMLVGFSKNVDIIEEAKLTNECGKYPIARDLKKPPICFGKGCLCLCKVDTFLASEFGGDLIVDCENEDVKCNSFEQSIIANNNCNYLMYYHTSKNTKNLLVNKNNENITIMPQA